MATYLVVVLEAETDRQEGHENQVEFANDSTLLFHLNLLVFVRRCRHRVRRCFANRRRRERPHSRDRLLYVRERS